MLKSRREKRAERQRKGYRPFQEARNFAHSLQLYSTSEWFVFCRGEWPDKGERPPDIPVYPNEVYADKGWKGFDNWLGTWRFAKAKAKAKTKAHVGFRPFHQARRFAHGLRLRSLKEWRSFCKGSLPGKVKRPPDIPADPQAAYAGKGWKGYGDWLGTGNIAPRLRQYRPFHKARDFARSLRLKSFKGWRAFCKGLLSGKGQRPPDIPCNPNIVYANKGWKGCGDWLGTGNIAPRLRQYRPFHKARAFAQNLRLKSFEGWRAFCKGLLSGKGQLPPDIPCNPNTVYANKGWKGCGDWLGTGNIAPRLRQYRPFHKARAFAQNLRLKNCDEWYSFCKGLLSGKGQLPPDIPADPYRVYANKGWKGYGDWLGTGTVATFLRQYRPFHKARDFAQNLRLKNCDEWYSFCKGLLSGKGQLPPDIPTDPQAVYAGKGWKGYGDWLGTGTIAPQLRQFRPFHQARRFAQGLRLRSQREWHSFCKGLLPDKVKRPPDIPADPQAVYAGKGWKGYGDWLGTGRRSRVLRPKSVALTDERKA